MSTSWISTSSRICRIAASTCRTRHNWQCGAIMPKTDRWKEDFPVPCDEDGYVTRREFTKFLGLTSIAFSLGTFAAVARKWWKAVTGTDAASVAVAGAEEIPVGGYKLF